MSELNNVPTVDFNFNYGNFNPEEVETDETINAVFIVDTSASTEDYIDEMTKIFNEFVETMQKSHVAPQLFVSIIEFDRDIKVKSGFQPIANIQPVNFRAIGDRTALYDAVKAGVENALEYRKNLENSGVNCKTLLFVITDGEDNHSKNPGSVAGKVIAEFKKDERSMFTFTSILFGVGRRASFEKAQKDMEIDHLAEVGTTGADLRKMINFISASISKSSSGQAISAPNF